VTTAKPTLVSFHPVSFQRGLSIQSPPAGKFDLFIHHPANGWLNGRAGRNGTPIVIKAGKQHLGTIKMKEN
jgi:hypothetical protein